MTRWVQLSAILPLLIAALLVTTVVVAVLRRPRPVCRGPRSWRDWLPWRWFGHSCGYDLSGLRVAMGQVRCPECGTLQSPGSRRALRIMPRLAAVAPLLVLAAACWKVSAIRYGRWAPYTPTWLLVQLDYLPMPERVETEVLRRLETGKVGQGQRARVATLAVCHLGGDKRRWNAQWACRALNLLGREAVPMLEAALDDADFQRRQYAADLLRRRVMRWWWDECPPEGYDPPDRLLEVSIEALRTDGFERSNASPSFRFLLRYRERVLPLLPAAIQSDDQQQAFVAAALSGFLKAEELAPLAAPVLVQHLRNNKRWGDARTAAPALVCMGDAARPYLLAAIDGDDPQARGLGWVIIKTLDHQPLAEEDRASLRAATMQYTDLRKTSEHPGSLSDVHGS